MVRAILALLLVGLLAGCTDDGGPASEGPQAADVAPPKSGLGSISGVVVDQSITPIAEATITIVGLGTTTETNDDGQFKFEDLEPGTYFLQADAVGFNATQTSVDVLADQVAKPKMALQAVQSKDPYYVTVQRNTFNIMSVPVLIVYYTGETIDIDGPFVDLTVEGVWRGDVLVSLEPDQTISTCVATDGLSQCILTAQEFWHVFSGENVKKGASALEWNSKPGFDTVSFQAEGELFFTTWYHAPSPDGWSVLAGDT